MESTNHDETPSFEAYMAQRRAKEEQLLSRISAALAVLEAQFPEVLRYCTGRADPYTILQRIASVAEDHLLLCERCTPFFEALLYLEQQHVAVFQEQDDQLMRLHRRLVHLEAKLHSSAEDEDRLDYTSLQDAYDAIKAAHDALQLEYQDLETVYHASLRTSQHHKEEDATGGEA